MSERISAEITIGGTLSTVLLGGLVQAINSQECRDDWGGGIVSLADPEEHGGEAASQLLALRSSNHHGCLWFCDEEAVNGEFEELEGFCEENDISFCRKSGGSLDYSPEVKEFRSGMEGADVYNTDNEGNPSIKGGAVQSLVAKAEAFLNGESSPEQSLADLKAAAESVRILLPVDVADLNSFDIA